MPHFGCREIPCNQRLFPGLIMIKQTMESKVGEKMNQIALGQPAGIDFSNIYFQRWWILQIFFQKIFEKKIF